MLAIRLVSEATYVFPDVDTDDGYMGCFRDMNQYRNTEGVSFERWEERTYR